MKRPSPREKIVKTIAGMLDVDPDAELDLDEFAIELIMAVREHDAETRRYAAVVVSKGYGRGYGPYQTDASARKALKRGDITVLSDERAGVVPLYHPDYIEAQREARDAV